MCHLIYIDSKYAECLTIATLSCLVHIDIYIRMHTNNQHERHIGTVYTLMPIATWLYRQI